MHLIGALGWTALAVVLIVAPLSQASEEECEFSNNAEKALQLQHRLVEAEKVLAERRGRTPFGHLRVLDKKLLEFEEPQCHAKNFHRCGYHTNQCVHFLFFCDGHKDCENGFDEKLCELPFSEGEYFVGEVVYDHCTQRRPKSVLLTLTKVHHHESSAPELEATLSLDLENSKNWRATVFTLHGAYDFLNRVAYFAPPEKDRLGVTLHFDGVGSDKFYGFIESFAHHDNCAKFFFHKVHKVHF